MGIGYFISGFTIKTQRAFFVSYTCYFSRPSNKFFIIWLPLQRFAYIWISKPILVATRFKAWVCSRSLVGIAVSNPAGNMDVCCECCECCVLWVLCVVSVVCCECCVLWVLCVVSCVLWVLCVVRWRSQRRADHSYRGILPSVVVRMWSWSLDSEEALTH